MVLEVATRVCSKAINLSLLATMANLMRRVVLAGITHESCPSATVSEASGDGTGVLLRGASRLGVCSSADGDRSSVAPLTCFSSSSNRWLRCCITFFCCASRGLWRRSTYWHSTFAVIHWWHMGSSLSHLIFLRLHLRHFAAISANSYCSPSPLTCARTASFIVMA